MKSGGKDSAELEYWGVEGAEVDRSVGKQLAHCFRRSWVGRAVANKVNYGAFLCCLSGCDLHNPSVSSSHLVNLDCIPVASQPPTVYVE